MPKTFYEVACKVGFVLGYIVPRPLHRLLRPVVEKYINLLTGEDIKGQWMTPISDSSQMFQTFEVVVDEKR